MTRCYIWLVLVLIGKLKPRKIMRQQEIDDNNKRRAEKEAEKAAQKTIIMLFGFQEIVPEH